MSGREGGREVGLRRWWTEKEEVEDRRRCGGDGRE